MIGEICAEIKNYFCYEADRHFGVWLIKNGAISPTVDFTTDYFRIVGSHRNDGVHYVGDNDLIDEGVFHGAVWIMSPPKSFIELAEQIKLWQEKNGKADSVAMSPYMSENFGGYGYSKAANSTAGGNATSWQAVFGDRLKQYRRIRVI